MAVLVDDSGEQATCGVVRVVRGLVVQILSNCATWSRNELQRSVRVILISMCKTRRVEHFDQAADTVVSETQRAPVRTGDTDQQPGIWGDAYRRSRRAVCQLQRGTG